MSYFNQISSLNPAVWFRFNETAGTPTNSGSLSCSITTTVSAPLLNENSSVDGRSIYFDGGDSYILSNFPSFSLFNDRSFSVEGWFKRGTMEANSTFNNMVRVNGATQAFGIRMRGQQQVGAGRVEMFLIPGTGLPTYTIVSTNSYADNNWHHFVATFNTTSIKLYIDGSLVASNNSITTPTTGYSLDQTSTKAIASSDGSSEFFTGNLDEIAFYTSELTSAQINANYLAGATVNYAQTAATASALAVQPVLNIDAVLAQAPATANAESGNHSVSNFDLIDLLDEKMETYDLEAWIKFNSNRINYGTGGTIRGIALEGSSTLSNLGPEGMYAGKSFSSVGEGGIGVDDPDSNIPALINDKVFSTGIWFNIPSGAGTGIKRVLYFAGANTQARTEVYIDSNGYINFAYRTTSGANLHTGSTNLRDGEWHYAAIRVDNNDVRYYLDGTEVHQQTVTGSKGNAFALRFGNIPADGFSDTSEFYVANFYIADHTEIDATAIDEIWDVGSRGTVIQAQAEIIPAVARFNNAFNDKVQELEANVDLRFDTNGTAENFGIDGTLTVGESNLTDGPINATKLTPSKNRYSYLIADEEDIINFAPAVDASDDTNTYNLYAKFNTVTTGEQWYASIGNSFDPATFSGYVIGADSDGPFFMAIEDQTDNTTWTTFHTNDTTLFGGYHMYTIIRDGATAKFYIDGILFDDYAPSGADNLFEVTLNAKDYAVLSGYDTTAVSHTYVSWNLDEFQIFDYALSQQQLFELFRSLTIDGPTPAEATFVMPAISAGFGPTVAADEFTASAEAVQPDLTTETNELVDPATAFATILMPNFGTTVNVNAQYGATAMTASADLVDPQFNIGDAHSASPFEASAILPDPLIIAGGVVVVNPLIALDATLVMPGIAKTLGALVKAQPLYARAEFTIPPAYFLLTDDLWYSRLYNQHAVPYNETSSTGASTARAFLKFFDDVTTSLGGATNNTNRLTNDIPFSFVINSPGTADTPTYANSKNIFLNISPEPALNIGTFDEYARKSATFKNVEFEWEGQTVTPRGKPHHIEFSIKTTKSNQVLMRGEGRTTSTPTGFQLSSIGLIDGKLYSMNHIIPGRQADKGWPGLSHPDFFPFLNDPTQVANGSNVSLLTGRKNIADGQWHHIVIQSGFTDNRTQIWIDGQLDIQSFSHLAQRTTIFGYNSDNARYQSDFETSGLSYDPGTFLSERDVQLNYYSYIKYEPIKPDVFLAGPATMGQNVKARGNRARMLYLYFEPQNIFDVNRNSDVLDRPRGILGLSTDDYIDQPPQVWFDYDVFPVDITGRYLSEMLKESSYGGLENRLRGLSPADANAIAQGATLTAGGRRVWVNARGSFRDPITDAPRYINLVNDLNLDDFDVIAFANYPDQSGELDKVARDEFVDSYFNVREKVIYENFVKSVREAVDTGISLLVTNPQLAVDLGIIDRYEPVPTLDDIVLGIATIPAGDIYTPTRVEGVEDDTRFNVGGQSFWADTWKNNKHRVLNTIPGLTNDPSAIIVQNGLYNPDGTLDFQAVNRYFERIEWRENGLAVGDEFLINGELNPADPIGLYYGVPTTNVKAGTVVTTFGSQFRRGDILVANPFANYATSIALRPGDILNGKSVRGKIFVSLVEQSIFGLEEYAYAELLTDFWIDLALEAGRITESQANELKADPANYDRRLENNDITQEEYDNIVAYWTHNGRNLVISATTGVGGELDQSVDFLGADEEANLQRRTKGKSRRSVQTESSKSSTFFSVGAPWASVRVAAQYPIVGVWAPNLNTRGLLWLSERREVSGIEIGQPAALASAQMVMPTVVADKNTAYTAQAMLANARITESGAKDEVRFAALPMEALATINPYVIRYVASPMIANAQLRDNARITTAALDDVILYIDHVDPILYVREDIVR